jgi:hypothetical protein
MLSGPLCRRNQATLVERGYPRYARVFFSARRLHTCVRFANLGKTRHHANSPELFVASRSTGLPFNT